MRVSDIIHLAQEYLQLGILAVLCVGVLFSISYFFIYKKLLHGTCRVSIKKMLCAALLLAYFVLVFGATMLSRGGYWGNRSIDFRPFISYREAWNSFSAKEWRNLILNVCMFVPLGFLLPLFGDWWRRCYRTYAAGLLLTVIIELAQLLLKRGIFEFDDIFNNVLGTMIGYSCYCIAYWVYQSVMQKKEPLRPVLLCQLPLLFGIGLFGSIFTVYHMKEFGNLSEQYVSKRDMSQTAVYLQTELSEEVAELPVYESHTASVDETRQITQEFFARLGTQIDESREDIYDETAVFYDVSGNYSVWIDYNGCSMWFTDFSQQWSDDGEPYAGLEGVEEAEIRTALEAFGIQIPNAAGFREQQDGDYIFDVEKPLEDKTGEVVFMGSLTCTYNENHKISSFHNSIITCQKYRDCMALSEQEAYEKLCEGKFKAEYYGQELSAIEAENVSVEYHADSKGFYQPLYAFEGKVDGAEAVIYIPAVK